MVMSRNERNGTGEFPDRGPRVRSAGRRPPSRGPLPSRGPPCPAFPGAPAFPGPPPSRGPPSRCDVRQAHAVNPGIAPWLVRLVSPGAAGPGEGNGLSQSWGPGCRRGEANGGERAPRGWHVMRGRTGAGAPHSAGRGQRCRVGAQNTPPAKGSEVAPLAEQVRSHLGLDDSELCGEETEN